MLARLLRSWWWEGLCFAVYFALAGSQLFVRPIVGVADNGDFPKVLGHFGICDPDPGASVLRYVRDRYIIDTRCNWDSRLPSSETLFVWIIRTVADWGGRTSFRITAAGKLHLSVMLAAFAILLWALHTSRPAVRFLIPAAAMLVFSDVLYVSYLNSFYMDAASMVFLLLTVTLSIAAILRPRIWVPLAFGISGVLLALSKTQHVMTGLLFGGFAAWLGLRAWREQHRYRAACWMGASIAIFAGGITTLSLSPNDYKAEPFYSVIFYNLIPASDNRSVALAEFGLPPADLVLVGTHAYSPESPVTQSVWREDFVRRVGYRKLLTYYFRHPVIAFRLLGHGLAYFAAGMRPGNLANFEREDGFPPGTLSQRPGWWSHGRGWITFIFPANLVILWGLLGIGAGLCLVRRDWAARWPLYPLVLVLTMSWAIEFLFAVLLDGTETSRHLFFFHVVTEVLILALAGALVSSLNSNKHKGLPS